MNRTYVALDLETTGLNPEIDEIIEIGAVKFRGDETTGTFESLVNPRRALPYRVRVLCGIEQSQLDAAPVFSEVSEGLRAFIGDSIVVGHNIAFDLGFLTQRGVELPNITCDTWELATIFLFQQPDYSLSSLARELGISPPRHRALPDAIASKELFTALRGRALKLDVSTLEDLVRLAEKVDWGLAYFFRGILAARAKTAFSPGGDGTVVAGEKGAALFEQPGERKLTASPQRVPVDVDGLASVLEPEGDLARSLPSYEYRPGQVSMMRAVADALNNGGRLMVEAGTGTGKSIAYLLPSILFSLGNGVPVVVSTNTINLQEQLVGKDIPDLLRTLELWRSAALDNLRVVQLKGRANYLCQRKFEALRASDRLTLDDAKVLARIMVWRRVTQTGDRAELSLGRNELSTWDRLCAEFGDRMEGQCLHRQKGTCYLHRARRAAENAHVIVVNHALLLSDMFAEAKILPPYEHLVVDESHHLEEEATNQLSVQVTQWDIFAYLNRFQRETQQQHRAGLPAWLDDCLRGSTVGVSRQRQLKQIAQSIADQVDSSQARASVFLDKVRDFTDNYTEDRGGHDRHLLLTSGKRRLPGWSGIEIAWDDLNLALKDIADDLERLYLGLEDLADNKVRDYDYLMVELSSLFTRNNELRQQIDGLVSRAETDTVYWLSVSGQASAVGLYAAPLAVKGVLERSLFSAKECVVLTGATLSTEGNFEYIKGRLGLEDVKELLLGAPFDYVSSTMVYLPHDIPDPTSSSYQQVVQRTLIDLCAASRGRTLVLFTSHAALRTTLAAIQGPLEEQGILVLGQGVDGSPKQLLAAFKATPQTVLLGTASFWEGVDVVGDALSVLAIARLPFNVPTEPIFAARSELFDDPFNQYAIPQAAIRFKQGFGRLIRSRTDRGAVVILDKRLQTKRYGSAFLDSIPLCTVVRGSCLQLPSVVAKWLGRGREA